MNFKPLIAEKYKGEYKDISLGRVAFWICFLMAVYVWGFGTGDINPSHIQMLYITTTYNLMKKATWFTSMKGKDGSTMEMQHGDVQRRNVQAPVVKKYYGDVTEFNEPDPYSDGRPVRQDSYVEDDTAPRIMGDMDNDLRR
jgi:hypothetical protein